MAEDGLKEAGGFVLLLILEKAAEELRPIIRDCGEDLLEMWKKFSSNMVRARGADHVARIYQSPWRKLHKKENSWTWYVVVTVR